MNPTNDNRITALEATASPCATEDDFAPLSDEERIAALAELEAMARRTWKERYRELEDAHSTLIRNVEKIMQADYRYDLKPMSRAECDRARMYLQDLLRSARRGIGQP